MMFEISSATQLILIYILNYSALNTSLAVSKILGLKVGRYASLYFQTKSTTEFKQYHYKEQL